MPSTPAADSHRLLFLDADPAAVAAWCRDRLSPGAVFVAPSAAARRRALTALVDANGIAVGVAVTTPGRLLPLLESRAGLASPPAMSDAVVRLLVADCAKEAGVPLFDGEQIPAGATRAVWSLIHSLRMNGVSFQEYRDAGGDARAADACARFDRRRADLGFVDDAERIQRLLAAGVPRLPLVVEDPTFATRRGRELYLAAFAAAPTSSVGLAEVHETGPAANAASLLSQLGFAVERGAGPAAADTPRMRGIGGAGAFDEMELVAREMLVLLREKRCTPSSILGVAPNAAYLRMLHRACATVGVPVASPQRVGALEVPLVRALLETMRLLADESQDTDERGLALLSAPYFGCSLTRHDNMSRTLVLRGLGALRTWRRCAPAANSARFQKFAEDVASLAAKLVGERRPREIAAVFTSLGLDYGFLAAGRATNLAAGNDGAVRMDQQAWDALLDAVDELTGAMRVMKVERITATRWIDELTELLQGTMVRAEARARAGVHLTIAGSGLPRADHVFAVGWREGLVPRRVREDPLLPDRVKRALNQGGALFVPADDRAAHEKERYERVRLAARETLTISWPATNDDGDQLLPSFYLHDMHVVDQSVRGIGDRIRSMPRGTFEPVARVQLPADVAADLVVRARRSSASQAGMLAHCVYEHFGKRRLRLAALQAPALDQLLLGSVAHAVLKKLGEAGFDPAVVDALLDEAWRRYVPDGLSDDPGAQFERSMLLRILQELAQGEASRAPLLASKPTHFEEPFVIDGAAAGVPSIELRGSIDRIDVVERNGARFGVAIDYKSGKGQSYFKKMEDLADFQLPIYCAVLPTLGIEPVGAMYLGISSRERYGVIRSDFADAFLTDDGCKGVKRLDSAAFADYMRVREDALRGELAHASSGELRIAPREDDCGYCDLRPVCRIGSFGIGGAFVAD